MRIAGTWCRTSAGVLALACTAAVSALHGQSASYLNYDDLTRELRSLVNGSNRATMRSLGTSYEGREIWLVEIGNPAGAQLDTRPGLLVVGNLSGDHVLGSALALETIRYLLMGGDSVVDAEAVLNERVVYVVPRLNPDGAEAMFGRARYDRRRNGHTFDDDNDGRIDEDPGEDLNGDGFITVMRMADPSGDYMVHPDDPRLMRRADPSKGESGAYSIYVEGRDSDGDGFLNEDGPGGVDLDRNFQHAYPYWARDAGPYMVSEPESRALMDFVVAHRNIGAILTFGHSDNLVTPADDRGKLAAGRMLDLPAFALASYADVFEKGVFATAQPSGFGGFGGGGGGLPRLRGAQPGRDNDPSSGRRPSTTLHQDDRTYFESVSEAYKEITGITRLGTNREAEGAFFQYGYFQYGVPSFSTAGWGLPAAPSPSDSSEPAARPRPAGGGQARPAGGGRPGGPQRPTGRAETDATVLKALDGADIDAFLDWTPFAHPDLGAVEIGGFRPHAMTNPPADDLPELGRAHGAFATRLAGMLPSVRIADTEVTNHGGGVFTVTVEVENTGYFPTSLRHGIVSRSVQPTLVQIQVPPEAVLTGADKTSRVPRLDGSGGREEITWVIHARAGTSVEIRVLSQKGGTSTTTVTLR